MHSAINYVALQLKSLSKFGTEVWYENKRRADIVLINGTKDVGMIIEMKYGGSAKNALDQTKNYIPIFKNYKHIKTIKSLGISVSPDKKVDIECESQESKYYSDHLNKKRK